MHSSYEVTMVELRGQGRSQGGRMVIKSHSWQEYIDDMQTAAETIDGDCTCFCHSNGGLTMAYATSTDQVKSLYTPTGALKARGGRGQESLTNMPCIGLCCSPLDVTETLVVSLNNG